MGLAFAAARGAAASRLVGPGAAFDGIEGSSSRPLSEGAGSAGQHEKTGVEPLSAGASAGASAGGRPLSAGSGPLPEGHLLCSTGCRCSLVQVCEVDLQLQRLVAANTFAGWIPGFCQLGS